MPARRSDFRQPLTDDIQRDNAARHRSELRWLFVNQCLKLLCILDRLHQHAKWIGRKLKMVFASPLAFVNPTYPPLITSLESDDTPRFAGGNAEFAAFCI